MPQLLQCRLVVLDHHGTTLLQAFAAHVPTVLFWDREAWGLCPEAEALLDRLAEAGIWFPTAESAAMHIREIWDHVPDWWNSEKVLAARQAWCQSYARTVEQSFDNIWVQCLKKI